MGFWEGMGTIGGWEMAFETVRAGSSSGDSVRLGRAQVEMASLEPFKISGVAESLQTIRDLGPGFAGSGIRDQAAGIQGWGPWWRLTLAPSV